MIVYVNRKKRKGKKESRKERKEGGKEKGSREVKDASYSAS